MSDNRGKGSGEGSIERNPSRPYENNPSNQRDPVKEQVNQTKDKVDKVLKK